MTTAPRVDVDYNARTWDGLVIAGFEATNDAMSIGQHVLAWQVDDQLEADAIVERIDADRRLIYLGVKWDTLREEVVEPTTQVLMPDAYRVPLRISVPPAAEDSMPTVGRIVLVS